MSGRESAPSAVLPVHAAIARALARALIPAAAATRVEPWVGAAVARALTEPVDLIDLVAKNLGTTQEVVNTQFDPIQSGAVLNSNQCDVVAGAISITETRQKNLDFSQSYFRGTQALLTKKGSGELKLTGTNTFTGEILIEAGVLSVDTLKNGGVASGIGQSDSDALSLTLNGGTLRYTGGERETNRLFSVGTAGGAIEASGTAAPGDSGAISFTNFASSSS